MTVSRSSGLILGGLAACLIWQGAALAQSTGPKVLRPEARQNEPPRPRAPDGIQVNRLDAPGKVAAGVLREEDGGLPADLWFGSERSMIAALLSRMPGWYTSPAARDVARRLLLSEGRVPEGQPDDSTLLGLRVSLVLSLGDAESAVSLAQAAGGGAQTPAVAEPYAEALFTLGEADRACGVVQGQLTLGGRGYWQEASVFCDIRAERIDAAELTLSLLEETGRQTETFSRLADALLSDRAVDIKATGDLKALDAAMMAASKSAVVRDEEKLPPHLAARLSGESKVVDGARIEAGVRAIQGAGMSPALIMLMFGNKAGEPGAPFRNPVVTAMSATTAIVRAEALNDLWSKASEPADQATAAAFAEGFLKKLQPEAGLAFLAPAAFRMSLLNGDFGRAEGWFAALRRSATAGNAEPAELARALALARLAGIGGVDDRAMQPWVDTALAANGLKSGMTVLLGLDALGQPASSDIWEQVLSRTPTSSDASAGSLPLWRQMVMAAGGERIGESIAAALALTGSGPAASADPVSLASIAGTFRRMGLEQQARRLLIEAVIGQGG